MKPKTPAMSRKKRSRARATGSNQEHKPQTAQNQDSMHQVRDLLFGAQMREIDQRLDQMQKSFTAEIKLLKDEITTGLFEPLQSYVKQENASLVERVTKECTDREQVIALLTSRSSETEQRLTGRLGHLDKMLAQVEQTMQESISEESIKLRDEIREKSIAQTAALDAQSATLKDEKADRSTLAALFLELSTKMNGECEPTTQVGFEGASSRD